VNGSPARKTELSARAEIDPDLSAPNENAATERDNNPTNRHPDAEGQDAASERETRNAG